ncbi:receptor-like protein 33 [Salvia hispanica]|uniref:receptor-like protein 33 n=1 Tax=Salvia hispanica TaxID=49212 RepID=UPI00200947C8|nr:receptor-like protein 33 [Salvia hispanica]
MLPLSLRVLVLRSNRFQGDLRCSKSWPDLQILDISSNDFSGRLNLLNFSSLRGMMLQSPTHRRLNRSNSNFLGYYSFYHNEVTLTVKGIEVKLVKIWPDFTSIDMSSNRFQGEIPGAIGMIPTGRQFQTFSADLFEGNAGLCGFPLDRSCSSSHGPGSMPSQPEDEEIEWEYVFAAFGYVVGFGSIAWTLLCCRSLRERYFEKIEEVVDKIFFERRRRRRQERRVRRRAERRNGVRKQHQ